MYAIQDKKLKSDICIMNSKPENIDEKANNKFYFF